MPGLQGDSVVAALGSPTKRSKLSLKFFQKKDTKRALDFSEPPLEESRTAESLEEPPASCDQEVPGPAQCPASPGPFLHCEKRETLVPFVGLNNLGNTCYLNSILQVLHYCPGLRDGIKKLYCCSKRQGKAKDHFVKSEEEQTEVTEESLPAPFQLLGSFTSLIESMEQLQSDYLLNSDQNSDGELATPPRKLLQTLRQLNPMYEGHLQHDAQEVLQCILGYIQDACDSIKKEQGLHNDDVIEVKPGVKAASGGPVAEAKSSPEDDESQTSGKRKSDTEVGNAKKKPKPLKPASAAAEEDGEKTLSTRPKRKSSSDVTPVNGKDDRKEEDEEEQQQQQEEEGEKKTQETERKGGRASKDSEEGKRKKRAKLGWLRPSGKQPSIFSKFCSMGRISSVTGTKSQGKTDQENTPVNSEPTKDGKTGLETNASKKPAQHQGCEEVDLMERLFQGRLVLRTRCLECESYTERREDFQDISVPVQEEQPCSPDDLSEISPDPKPEVKTLKWAISQFASVERIVGEDKYFCETCHHYTEAERSLLFDKTPEVVTIHLKCFSANGLELDPYAGLSKVNTPLQTPLTLSLEEWCAQPSTTGGRHYELFAVVMHSGVTISSGHYTTYIRMSDLGDTRLWPQDKKKGGGEGEEKEENFEAQLSEGALDYDDGEVSFSLSRRRRDGVSGGPTEGVPGSGGSNRLGGKKSSEGVGLLGGQRSTPSRDLSAGAKQPDRTAEDERRRRRTTSRDLGAGNTAETGPGVKSPADGVVEAEQQALSNLLEFEGKWLLFDDSEVRSFEEEDFLRACSPDTCSTSTPYLLFYRRVSGPQH